MIEALEGRRLLSGGPVVTQLIVSPRSPTPTTLNGTVVLTVTLFDADGIDPTTITNSNIRIAGPNGFARYARAESSISNADGSQRIVRYKMRSPGLLWTSADNGVYLVTLHGLSVQDVLGNFADFKKLGSFRVAVVNTPRAGGSRATQGFLGGQEQFSTHALPTDPVDHTLSDWL